MDLEGKEPNAIWRGKYELPKEDDSRYDSYFKELTINSGDDCKNGCYLLIKIVPVQEQEYVERFFSYSLMINSFSMESNYALVYILFNSYIIDICESRDTWNRGAVFYFNINEDFEKIIFDVQSENVDLYVNIGIKVPYQKIYHEYTDFQLYSERETNLFMITKKYHCLCVSEILTVIFSIR